MRVRGVWSKGAGLIAFLSGTVLLAQEPSPHFRNFSVEHGLSHSKVNCIYQDSQGFMWFGTNEGLNRFDAYEFKVFQWDPESPGSLSANLVRCIFEDSHGRLWIGTEAGGLNLFDRGTETFTHFSADSTSPVSLGGKNVNAILEDREGNLWLATENGLDRLNPDTGEIAHYPLPVGKEVPTREVLALCEDPDGRLWVGTAAAGLALFDRRTQQWTFFRHRDGDPSSIGDNAIYSLHVDTRGRLWIGTAYGGLNLLDRRTMRFHQYHPDPDDPESTTIRAILDDGRGNLWVGNRSGLYRFNPRTGQFVRYNHNPSDPASLAHNSVLTLFKDRKGDLWIGTRGGVSYLSFDLPFYRFRAEANNPRCLNDGTVYALLEDRQGNLWFGTEHGGLNYLDRTTGLFTYYTRHPQRRNSLSVNNIKALLEDRHGNLWIGTYGGGLNILDPSRTRFTHLSAGRAGRPGLSANHVMALLEDREGAIWVGTYGGGLDLVRARGPRIEKIERVLPNDSIPGFENILALCEDRQGAIWVGSGNNRVACLNKRTGAIRLYLLGDRTGNVDTRCIVEDSRGRLWFGTVGAGLYCLDSTRQVLRNYTRKDGLPSNTVYGILEDNHGFLWLSTTNGLSRFDPRTGQCKNYGREAGLASDQFNYNAYCRTRRGEMLFGGINGVTIFHPDSIRENAYVPPVVITDFRIFNRPVLVGGKEPILRQHISQTSTLVLSYRHSVFSFEFAALNYANSEQNQYAYKMEGFDQDWIWAGNRRFAVYTNLNPGTYTFRVRAANNDGRWNDQGVAVRIRILPPFWQTWWFRLLLVLILGVLAYHFMDYQKQKRNALKAMALANEAQLKLLRYQMNPHFLFNAHNSIRSMIHIDKDRAWQMITELSEFFRYTLMNFNKLYASLEEELNALNNYLHIEKIRYGDSLDVRFEIDDAARQCLIPAFTFQPLVENAIRYGMKTGPIPLKVAVVVRYRRGILSIDVSNTGRLLSPKETGTDGDLGLHGTSLQNIRQRLEIMFRNRHSFRLYEQDGWVHARIRIRYKRPEIASRLQAHEERLS
ncbi:MAG: histidine kinase [candidate division KSB1 bacterium]|nr:histidine kinase [candidate division KSB1 bacterium]